MPSVAVAFVGFEGGNLVLVSSFDLWVCGYYPSSLQSADSHLPTVEFFVDRAVDVSAVRPFQPSSPILSKGMPDDGAGCLETTVDSVGTAAEVLGTVVVELVADDTSDSFQASDSCFACFDSLECCLHIHLHAQCLALMVPSFDAVDSFSSYVEIDSHA